MTGLDVSQLSATDAAVALRSYPRRYRAMFTALPGDGDDLDALARRAGPDGVAAFDLIIDAVRSLAVLSRALHQVVHEETPTLHPAVADAGARRWEHPPLGTLADALDELTDEANELAEAVAHVSPRQWRREGTLAGASGGPPTIAAIDIVREAVRTVADDLRAAEAALAAARRR